MTVGQPEETVVVSWTLKEKNGEGCSSSLSQSAVRLTLSNYHVMYLSFHIFFPTIPVSEMENQIN